MIGSELRIENRAFAVQYFQECDCQMLTRNHCWKAACPKQSGGESPCRRWDPLTTLVLRKQPNKSRENQLRLGINCSGIALTLSWTLITIERLPLPKFLY